MKKILTVLIALLILSSCEMDEAEYSCDPVINDFVLENFSELSKLSVVELNNYEIPLQKAVFRSWSPEKKRNAWIKKLKHILKNTSFLTKESKHIEILIEHLKEGYFEENKTKKDEELKLQFANNWLKYAKEELGWDEKFIAFIVYRLYTNQSQFDAETYSLKSASASTMYNSESESCNCNTSSDFCSYSSCNSSGCSNSSGCGWFWSEVCNGSC